MKIEHSSPSFPAKISESASPYVTMLNTSPPVHPAFTISNITYFIKITLSLKKVKYNTWFELFKIHARVHQVIDHIISSQAKPYHLLISKTPILLSGHVLMLWFVNEFMPQVLMTFFIPSLSVIQLHKMRGTNYLTFL